MGTDTRSRTGHESSSSSDSDDPFSDESQDDPLGIGPDSSSEDDSDSDDFTFPPGMPQMPNLPAPAPPPPRAGTTELTMSIAKLPTFFDPDLKDVPAFVVAAEGFARRGRDSYADAWTVAGSMVVAVVNRVEAADPSRADAAGATRTAVADPAFASALKRWTDERSKPQPDLTELAGAADAANAAADAFLKFAGNRSMTDPIDVNVETLASAARGIVRAVADEGQATLKGDRIPAVGKGEAVCIGAELRTRDGIWRKQLYDTRSWLDASGRIEQSLKKVLGTTTDLDGRARKSAAIALDTASKALDKPSPGADLDTLRRNLLTAYTGLANAIHRDYTAVKSQLEARNAGSGGTGWSAAQCAQGLDLLAGSMRVLGEHAAADQLSIDPYHAGAMRNLVAFCTNSVDPTTQEALAKSAADDFRGFWKTGKDAEIKALKSFAKTTRDRELTKQVAALETQFTQGLGPLLDDWSDQVESFPRQDRIKLHDLAIQIAATLATYRDAVLQTVGKSDGVGVLRRLDAIATALATNIRAHQGRGGVFG